MNPIERTLERQRSQSRRERALAPQRIEIPFEGPSEGAVVEGRGGLEVVMTVTDGEGEAAAWFTDAWWLDRLRRWADRLVSIRLAPTCRGALNPIVLHEMAMLRRVVPRWRLSASVFVEDLTEEGDIDLLATAPYDEVVFSDSPRQPEPNQGYLWRVEQTMSRIRQKQAGLRVNRPVLSRGSLDGHTLRQATGALT